jgi:hypothetical protein
VTQSAERVGDPEIHDLGDVETPGMLRCPTRAGPMDEDPPDRDVPSPGHQVHALSPLLKRPPLPVATRRSAGLRVRGVQALEVLLLDTTDLAQCTTISVAFLDSSDPPRSASSISTRYGPGSSVVGSGTSIRSTSIAASGGIMTVTSLVATS